MLTEQEGRVEQLIATIRRRPVTDRRKKAAIAQGLSFEVPTGAIAPDSPLYIERQFDHVIRQQVTREGSTTHIEGARQMGKSSLVARMLTYVRSQQYTVVDFDFQSLDEQSLRSLESLLRYLADMIHGRLRLPLVD